MSLQLFLSLMGAVGLGTLIEALRRGRTLNRAQRFYRWRYGESLDVVITTADCPRRGDVSLHALDRLHAQLGYIHAATNFSRGTARARSRKPIEVHVSEGITSELNGDLVLLGGTGGNEFCERFLEHLRTSTGAQVVYDESDERRNSITVGHVAVDYDWVAASQEPDRMEDFALVVMWINPFAVTRRRGIMCAGFTPIGTRAATNYLVAHSEDRRSSWANHGRHSVRNWRRWPAFAMLLQIDFLNGFEYEVHEIARLPLSVPAMPLPTLDRERNRTWKIREG